MSAAKTVLVMAGGTGGHVFPALATAERLREAGYRIDPCHGWHRAGEATS